MINIKNLDPNKIKIGEKSLDMWPHIVQSLIFNKINGYIEESNGNKKK